GVQPVPHVRFVAHAGVLPVEIFLGVGDHDAALSGLVVSGTPTVHGLGDGGESVTTIRLPEAGFGLRIRTRYRRQVSVLDGKSFVRRPLGTYLDVAQNSERQGADHTVCQQPVMGTGVGVSNFHIRGCLRDSLYYGTVTDVVAESVRHGVRQA